MVHPAVLIFLASLANATGLSQVETFLVGSGCKPLDLVESPEDREFTPSTVLEGLAPVLPLRIAYNVDWSAGTSEHMSYGTNGLDPKGLLLVEHDCPASPLKFRKLLQRCLGQPLIQYTGKLLPGRTYTIQTQAGYDSGAGVHTFRTTGTRGEGCQFPPYPGESQTYGPTVVEREIQLPAQVVLTLDGHTLVDPQALAQLTHLHGFLPRSLKREYSHNKEFNVGAVGTAEPETDGTWKATYREVRTVVQHGKRRFPYEDDCSIRAQRDFTLTLPGATPFVVDNAFSSATYEGTCDPTFAETLLAEDTAEQQLEQRLASLGVFASRGCSKLDDPVQDAARALRCAKRAKEDVAPHALLLAGLLAAEVDPDPATLVLLALNAQGAEQAVEKAFARVPADGFRHQAAREALDFAHLLASADYADNPTVVLDGLKRSNRFWIHEARAYAHRATSPLTAKQSATFSLYHRKKSDHDVHIADLAPLRRVVANATLYAGVGNAADTPFPSHVRRGHRPRDAARGVTG